MAAARSVVASVDDDCDTAKLVRVANCGMAVSSGNGAALAKAILAYHCDPKERIAAGLRGREYFLQHLEKRLVTKQYLDLLTFLTQKT
jgi:hypothetical protein